MPSAFDKTETPEVEEVESYVAKLVETKGETWKDPEVIARGKLESDKFIEDLKRQNEELRAQMKREEELAELVATIKAQHKAPEGGGEPNPPQDESQHTARSQNPEEIEALVERMFSEKEQKTTRQKNIEAVDAELTKKYGNNANAVVARAARELDMTVEEAQELAATKPRAFFRLMGLDQDNRPNPGMVGNALNSAAGMRSKSNVRDNEYYKNLKKEIGTSKFYSPKIQRQLADDRQALGSAFWSNQR